ncbi:TrkH family potassium uptake protein [Dactylococcopsis salina]|uniref:Potassium uptake protein, TrkH family n=1 Tax=Dactylococcopsis salina (strain PCC 8305) TaxID=13035 RepID=K9YW12_DACS8|nr:TrkH family potassium uptake protein [Dactylococcopsis salina]AFZ51089.1 potassium uptake protein, TrkH family [Dactylococcopsis salina PCC 8305]
MSIARTICLGFIAVIFIGTLLLTLPFTTAEGNWNDPITALFTATSAVCVTGLAVVDTGTYFSFWGQLIILLLIQVGGLGYMTTNTFLLFLIRNKFDFRQKIAIQESFDRPFLQGSKNLLTSIVATTIIFELTGFFLLLPLFSEQSHSIWLALFHSISAWNNAGFSLFSNSLMDYRSSLIANLVIPFLIIFGGLGYQAIFEIFIWLRQQFDRIILKKSQEIFVFSLNSKIVTNTTVILLILGTIAFFLTDFSNKEVLGDLPLKERLLGAWFQSVTTRTAGFNTIDISKMTDAGLFITIAFMVIGASPSGTGGGLKTTTLRILINATISTLQGKTNVIIYKRRVPVNLILKALGVLCAFFTLLTIVTALIAITDPDLSFIQILFEVCSAFATVGLSTGITGSLSALGKLIIVVTMYMGRVGILIVINTIVRESHPSTIQYPEENLLVG